MSLVVIVIRILANDDHFDVVQGGVSGPTIGSAYGLGPNRGWSNLPRIDILLWRKDLDIGIFLLLQESFQVQEFSADHFILQVSEPALI
jgi:hypothetical protein